MYIYIGTIGRINRKKKEKVIYHISTCPHILTIIITSSTASRSPTSWPVSLTMSFISPGNLLNSPPRPGMSRMPAHPTIESMFSQIMEAVNKSVSRTQLLIPYEPLSALRFTPEHTHPINPSRHKVLTIQNGWFKFRYNHDLIHHPLSSRI